MLWSYSLGLFLGILLLLSSAEADATGQGGPGLAPGSITLDQPSSDGGGRGQPRSINPDEAERSSWRFTLRPSGRHWFRQMEVKDPLVTWDFGATVHLEIGRGGGHRVWFGGTYRQSAGYASEQQITPFDPRHIDTYQHLAWRYRPAGRSWKLLMLTSRACFHEVDVHNPRADFLTHLGFGVGSQHPNELGQWLFEDGGKRLDHAWYLLAGPVVHGGPSRIFGRSDTWQGIANSYVALRYPFQSWLSGLLELRTDLLRLHENAQLPWRWRSDVRAGAVFSTRHGAFLLVLGRVLHDDFIDRRLPVSNYMGLEYRF